MEEVLAADGSTCDYRMSEILSKDQRAQQKHTETGETIPETKETTTETKETTTETKELKTETKEPKTETKETESIHKPRERKGKRINTGINMLPLLVHYEAHLRFNKVLYGSFNNFSV